MAKMNEQDLQKVLKSLKANRFDPVEYVDTLGEASKLVLSMIPQEAKVSMGGSTSLMQLGVLDELIKRGSMTLSRPDIYLTSSNAITMDGKLVNTDMTGNRVTSMIFGPTEQLQPMASTGHSSSLRVKTSVAAPSGRLP